MALTLCNNTDDSLNQKAQLSEKSWAFFVAGEDPKPGIILVC